MPGFASRQNWALDSLRYEAMGPHRLPLASHDVLENVALKRRRKKKRKRKKRRMMKKIQSHHLFVVLFWGRLRCEAGVDSDQSWHPELTLILISRRISLILALENPLRAAKRESLAPKRDQKRMNRSLLLLVAFLDWECEDCEEKDWQKKHQNEVKFEDLFDL